MRNILVASMLAMGVAACAAPAAQTSGVAQIGDQLAKIAAFTVADLQAADADAVAHNDVLAHACYPALIKFVGDLQGASQGALTVNGAFSAFQKTRDLGRSAQSGIPDYLKLGCAPLVQDETVLIAKIAAIGGGSAVLGPIAPMVLP